MLGSSTFSGVTSSTVSFTTLYLLYSKGGELEGGTLAISLGYSSYFISGSSLTSDWFFYSFTGSVGSGTASGSSFEEVSIRIGSLIGYLGALS